MNCQQRAAASRNASSRGDLPGIVEADHGLGLRPPFLACVDDPSPRGPRRTARRPRRRPRRAPRGRAAQREPADLRQPAPDRPAPRPPRTRASFPRCRGRTCSCRTSAARFRRRSGGNGYRRESRMGRGRCRSIREAARPDWAAGQTRYRLVYASSTWRWLFIDFFSFMSLSLSRMSAAGRQSRERIRRSRRAPGRGVGFDQAEQVDGPAARRGVAERPVDIRPAHKCKRPGRRSFWRRRARSPPGRAPRTGRRVPGRGSARPDSPTRGRASLAIVGVAGMIGRRGERPQDARVEDQSLAGRGRGAKIVGRARPRSRRGRDRRRGAARTAGCSRAARVAPRRRVGFHGAKPY